MLLLKVILPQLFNRVLRRLPIRGNWRIGSRRCMIFLDSWGCYFIMFLEKLMLWRLANDLAKEGFLHFSINFDM